MPHGGKRARTGSAVVVVALLAGALVALAPASPAGADQYPPVRGIVSERPADGTLQFVDGETRSIAEVGDRVVVGGTFTQVGPAQLGAAGVVNTGSSAFGSGFADVNGAVYAAQSDGAGGYFLAGDFSSVGGQARQNLAQVDASGAVTGWAPTANAVVRSLAVTADAVVVGGDFTTLNGAPAARLAKVDRAAGALLWNANASGGSVRSVLVNGFTGWPTPAATSPRSAATPHASAWPRWTCRPVRSWPGSPPAPSTWRCGTWSWRAPACSSPATSPR